MVIAEFLSPSNVFADLVASEKVELLHELSNRAAVATKLSVETVSKAILKREALGSTGTGEGIAIPHARFSELKKPLGLLAHLRKAIDFEAIDGKPVDIVFLLLLPDAHAGQLNVLASVARMLRDREIAANIRRANESAQIYRAMVGQ